MSRSNDLRSQSLDLLRFPLAVVVLMIHTFSTEGFKIHGTEISFESMPILLEINYFIDGFLRGQSVPIYFFISGYVFFLGIELSKDTYIKKLKNRFHSLFIPYIVWNILALLLSLSYFLPCFSSLFPNIHKCELDFSLSPLLSIFWDSQPEVIIRPIIEDTVVTNSIYPMDAPLWFVRDLMVVVLCTPLINWLLKYTRYYLVLLLGVSWFVLGYWDLGHINMLLTAFFFFSWGAYMSINKKDMLIEFGRFFKASIILYPLLALLYVASMHYFPEMTTTIKRINVFVGLLFAYNLAAWLLKKGICKVNSFLAASSFFIYVGHMLICRNLLKLTFLLIHPTTDLGMLSIYVLATLLTIALLLFAFYLLRRFTPRLLKIVAGRK